MKNLVILGGSRNLGRYLAISFLKKFENVIVISKSGYFTDQSKKTTYAKIFHYSVDLSDKKKLNLVMKKIKKKFKRIDLTISCTGNSKKTYKNLEHYSDWVNSLNSNFFCFTNFLETYQNIFKNRKTKIIVISSIAGYRQINAPITYSVSKHALNYYCLIKSKNLARYKILINVISPGNIYQQGNLWSKKIKENPKKVKNYIKENVPLNSFCTPNQIFELCNYLYSKNGDIITGSNFILDGGQTL